MFTYFKRRKGIKPQPKVLVIPAIDSMCIPGGDWRPQQCTFAHLLGACTFYVTASMAAYVCSVKKRKCEFGKIERHKVNSYSLSLEII